MGSLHGGDRVRQLAGRHGLGLPIRARVGRGRVTVTEADQDTQGVGVQRENAPAAGEQLDALGPR